MNNEKDEDKKLELYSDFIAQKMIDSRPKVRNDKIKLEDIFGAIQKNYGLGEDGGVKEPIKIEKKPTVSLDKVVEGGERRVSILNIVNT